MERPVGNDDEPGDVGSEFGHCRAQQRPAELACRRAHLVSVLEERQESRQRAGERVGRRQPPRAHGRAAGARPCHHEQRRGGAKASGDVLQERGTAVGNQRCDVGCREGSRLGRWGAPAGCGRGIRA